MKFSCLLRYSEYEAGDRDFPDVPSRLLEDIFQVQTDTHPNMSQIYVTHTHTHATAGLKFSPKVVSVTLDPFSYAECC